MSARTVGIVAAAIAAALVVPVACTVITAPGRVAQRTLGTENIIHNYEWFFDVNAQHAARTAQITSHKALVAAEVDPDELRRLRVELAAMQQSCRDLAAQYNANSAKQNRDLFKARSLPESLSCAE